MFGDLKKAGEMVALAGELQALDVGGKKGVPDCKEYLILAGRLSEKLHEVHQIAGEIEELFGADVAAIKKRFGVE